MNIGYKLAMERRKKELTQEKAAELLGISRSSLSMYENDKKKLPFSVFIKMAYLYEFDVFEILRVNDGDSPLTDEEINELIKQHEWYWAKKRERIMNELIVDEVIYLDQ